jgi:hypothetical protein
MQAGTFLEVLNMLKTYIAAVFAHERVIAEHVARKINGCYLPASDNTDLSFMVSALYVPNRASLNWRTRQA